MKRIITILVIILNGFGHMVMIITSLFSAVRPIQTLGGDGFYKEITARLGHTARQLAIGQPIM